MTDKIKLSERIRPDSEAAPFVIEEIKKLEEQVLIATEALKMVKSLAKPESMNWEIATNALKKIQNNSRIVRLDDMTTTERLWAAYKALGYIDDPENKYYNLTISGLKEFISSFVVSSLVTWLIETYHINTNMCSDGVWEASLVQTPHEQVSWRDESFKDAVLCAYCFSVFKTDYIELVD